MKSVVTLAGDHADLAAANRRTFLLQAGTSAGLLAAGMVSHAATPVNATASQPAKALSSAFWPDRISGTPQMVRVWDAFLHYAKRRPGVAFLRKDEIARFVRQSPLTLRESETI